MEVKCRAPRVTISHVKSLADSDLFNSGPKGCFTLDISLLLLENQHIVECVTILAFGEDYRHVCYE